LTDPRERALQKTNQKYTTVCICATIPFKEKQKSKLKQKLKEICFHPPKQNKLLVYLQQAKNAKIRKDQAMLNVFITKIDLCSIKAK